MPHRTGWMLAAALSATLLTMCTSPRQPPPAEPLAGAPTPAPGPGRRFEATAYTIEGTTRSGTPTRDGIVAADPRILPLGTRIRVSGAGRYDGEYLVADTGRAIKGAEIDIYIRDNAAAKRFGRQTVMVEVLEAPARAAR
ncbi:MAG: 3D domain-containing protein [Deltaproteobacteria bacterium]|nr:3D domain-containing protein [Deltaproteobacteria bacterium]